MWLNEKWLNLFQDRDKWRTVVDLVIKLGLFQKAAIFWTSCGTVSLWRRVLIHMGCREYCAESKEIFFTVHRFEFCRLWMCGHITALRLAAPDNLQLQKATVSFVMSVRPSVCRFVRMQQLGFYRTDFREFGYLRISRKPLLRLFLYFFNIPTNAHKIYTLKSTKIHIKKT
jgi:hypothetical protein